MLQLSHSLLFPALHSRMQQMLISMEAMGEQQGILAIHYDVLGSSSCHSWPAELDNRFLEDMNNHPFS